MFRYTLEMEVSQEKISGSSSYNLDLLCVNAISCTCLTSDVLSLFKSDHPKYLVEIYSATFLMIQSKQMSKMYFIY